MLELVVGSVKSLISSTLLLVLVLQSFYVLNLSHLGLMDVWRLLRCRRRRRSSSRLGNQDEIQVVSEVIEERLSQNPEDYCISHGYHVENHHVITDDKFILTLHRVVNPKTLSNQKAAVVLAHGLLQSAGIFVTSSKDSLAFFLADLGHEVWLCNIRGAYAHQEHRKARTSDAGLEGRYHLHYSMSDQEFWDWKLDDLGRFDFPAIVRYVYNSHSSNVEKIVYMGHSQGTAIAFMGLSQFKELNDLISVFVAMAPAYYIGDVKNWALQLLCKQDWKSFEGFFGKGSFIPIMNVVQKIIHPSVFTLLSYHMFSYLFDWTDTKWEKRHKDKYFQCSPRPVSSKLVHQWMQIIRHGKLIEWSESGQRSEPKHYSIENINCKVAVFQGAADSLVDANKLLQDLHRHKVDVVYEESISNYEHMDLLWAKTARTTVFEKLERILRQFGN